jgi:hypothetical protein
MKQDARTPPAIHEGHEGHEARLDAENAEFDFAKAPRPGRNELYERAQGHFYEVPDAKDGSTRADGRQTSPRGRGADRAS